MKILVIGLGSIGTRHFNNLRSLGYENIFSVSRNPERVKELSPIKNYSGIEKALADQAFSHAVVATPTAFHTEAMEALVKHKVQNIYLEKPVSHTSDNLESLNKRILEFGLNVSVGFDLRFDPGIKKVKELIASNVLGDVLCFDSFVGQYLPDWRPYEDHRKGMSAKISTGGGVLLDLVHEFDYLYSFFGEVDFISAFVSNSGTLEIETEEFADCLFRYNDSRIGHLHLDYLQRKLIRYCRITSTKGGIYLDLANKAVRWHIGTEDFEFSYEDYERNERFIEVMKDFMTSPTGQNQLCSFSEGIYSLKMVERAKQYSKSTNSIQN